MSFRPRGARFLAAFWLGLLALTAVSCVGSGAVERAQDLGPQLFVLGTAQDGGLPHLGCERPCCEDARRNGRVLYPACLGVADQGRLLLLEATPKVEEQVALLHRKCGVQGRGRRPVDAVLLTHAHMGHYLGLAHFGREAAATQGLPVHVSARMAAFLRGHGPWRQLVELGQIVLQEHAPAAAFEVWPGLLVTAIPVPHRDEYSDTMAYVVQGPRRRVLFVPDVDAWEREPGLLERLVASCDTAYVDGTFYDGSELPERNLAEIRHPLMTDTMARLAEHARVHPGKVRFLHLNHSNPALHDPEIQRRIEARGFAVAQQGEAVAL